MDQQRVVMCLDMDAFFVSVERARHPELRGKPVVVGGRLGGRGVVTSASYEARAYGVHSAMPLAQAQRRCPHALFVPGHHDRYREASRQVRALLEEVSPYIEMASIDEAYLDLSGTERSLGPPLQVARRLQQRIQQRLRLPSSIAVAGNKVVAKVACDRAKPNGLLQVPPGQEAAFLAPLPVTDLPGIGPRTAAQLAELRIRTCGDLSQAPTLLLQRLLGGHAAALQQRAQGVDHTPVRAQSRQPRSISRSTTLAEDARDPTFLRAVLHNLAERVGHTLRSQDLGAGCVAVQVRWADFTTRSHQRTLSHPIASDAALCQIGDELLAHLLTTRRQRVRLLGIQTSQLAPAAFQLPLLLPERRQERQALELSSCLDQIRDRYGFRAIQRGSAFLLRDGQQEPQESQGW